LKKKLQCGEIECEIDPTYIDFIDLFIKAQVNKIREITQIKGKRREKIKEEKLKNGLNYKNKTIKQ